MSDAYIVRQLYESEYDIWDNFVDISPQGSLYNKSWWLKAVSGQFKILVCMDGSGIIGGIALPSIYRRFYRNPSLTPTLGILLNDFAVMKPVNKISKEISVMCALIEKLPSYLLFDYVFSENYINCLPFKWEKFRFDIEYAYVIRNLRALETELGKARLNEIFNQFKGPVKEKIKKAIKSGIRITTEDFSIDRFYELDNGTYMRQNSNITYTKEFLVNLDNALKERNSRKILFAVDKDNNILGANYIVYDRKAAHGVAMCSSEEGRKLGIPSLLVWEAIKFASEVSGELNFEGSSIKSVELFLRGFGGELIPRLRINKCSWLIRTMINILKRHKGIVQKVIVKKAIVKKAIVQKKIM